MIILSRATYSNSHIHWWRQLPCKVLSHWATAAPPHANIRFSHWDSVTGKLRGKEFQIQLSLCSEQTGALTVQTGVHTRTLVKCGSSGGDVKVKSLLPLVCFWYHSLPLFPVLFLFHGIWCFYLLVYISGERKADVIPRFDALKCSCNVVQGDR